MDLRGLGTEALTALDETLGYLNLSSGAPDPRFERNINRLIGLLEADLALHASAWMQLQQALAARLTELQAIGGAFADVSQAAGALAVTFDHLLPAYRQYHRDLLHHQTEAMLFRPFFVARACEATLRQGGPWTETERIVADAITELNDFIGYRPIATLNTPQKIEPYDHEWVCPVPLYIRDAGVAVGQFQPIVEQAMAILAMTSPEILDQAWFDPKLLDELALDPRAYDFDHPVNKRPNHHFGQWDPHRLDRQGNYRRFVLQGVTLEAAWQRTQERGTTPQCELIFEAGAVLAGTMLMASAIWGRGPDTHDSSVTLSKLLPRITACRDAFYQQLIDSVPGEHGKRLRAEAATLRQPFGGARQHLNQRLARLRATQLQHVHLAQLFARMGYADASNRQAEVVPVASARMLCEISGRLTEGHYAIDRGQWSRAGQLLPEIEDLLHRAIECGALVDPWNILGFQGQFSLFPAMENSVRDHRVDVLVHLMQQIFGLYARLDGEAAARGDRELQQRLTTGLKRVARWWDQFASIEVSGVERLSGREAAESAAHVSNALGEWHQAGKAAGDIAFWRQHVSQFNSPKAYALVIDALLQKGDYVASRALLVQWVSQSEQVPLTDGPYSFHELAVRWLKELLDPIMAEFARIESDAAASLTTSPGLTPEQRWSLARKFFDFLEANAEEYWEVPRFEWQRSGVARVDDEVDEPEDEDNEHGDFGAAYEQMVYRDSTADGVEGETLEGGPDPTDQELDDESSRISKRLAFLVTLSRLWRIAATRTLGLTTPDRGEALLAWCSQARQNRRRLVELMDAVQNHRLNEPRGTHESLVEYDRRRMTKESLLARIIVTCVESNDSARMILASIDTQTAGANGGDIKQLEADLPEWERLAVIALRAMFRGEAEMLRGLFPLLRSALEQQPVLYIPLAKNGDPKQIVSAQTAQQLLMSLLHGLPRLGLLSETCQLIVTAQMMEKHRPSGEGAVTEFDRLFEAGYLAIVESLVLSTTTQRPPSEKPAAGKSSRVADEARQSATDADLIDSLQTLTESLLKRWLDHSRSLRLSALEKVGDKDRWQNLVQFIQTYGPDLFTQRWLNMGNLRAILHQSVDAYLRRVQEEGEQEFKLLDDLDGVLSRQSAVENLTVVIEAIVENYAEYKDFNSTTTQSDRGDLMYMFLDFLRLKASYERVAWNIKPVIMAHEVLVRRGKAAAAELWRRSVAQRTSDVADMHLRRMAELSKQYGLRLPTVADRLNERFVRTLAIDRIRALIRPAIEEVRRGAPPIAFELLEQEINEFAEHPTGAGLDVPAWLLALEQEANLVLARNQVTDQPADDRLPVPQVWLSWEEVQTQLRSWDAPAA
jgi:hypothetical protein